VRWVALAVAGTALIAGCGGSKHADAPTNALLTGVHVDGKSVRFDFKSAPGAVKAAYEPKARIVESGSGAPVPLKGKAYVVIHFVPAASADVQGEKVILTYTGPKRRPRSRPRDGEDVRLRGRPGVGDRTRAEDVDARRAGRRDRDGQLRLRASGRLEGRPPQITSTRARESSRSPGNRAAAPGGRERPCPRRPRASASWRRRSAPPGRDAPARRPGRA
jgi:hypothetical protein